MLRIDHLTVAYGAHRALEDVSIHVGRGEICVILGANGAGKSTLLKAVAGMVGTAPGAAINIGGKAITGLKPHRIVESGVALVPEGRGIFGDMTVGENLQLGAYGVQARAGEAQRLKQVLELFPKLGERRGQVARTMSGGEQQMVAIGRALMSNPAILMLDEPSLGLSPLLTRDLFRSLRAVRESGVGILLVEQNAKQSLAIADRGYLLENGHIVGEDSADRLARDPAVQAAYLGGAVAREPAAARPAPAMRPATHPAPAGRAPIPAAGPQGAIAADGINADTMAEALARHAGRIQRDHVRRLRGGAVNGHAHRAFDAHVASGEGIVMSKQAMELAGQAGAFAKRAQERQHAFLLARRQAGQGAPQTAPGSAAGGEAPRSPPPAAPPPTQPSPPHAGRDDAASLARLAGDLATRARQRQADHLAARRTLSPVPAEPVAATPAGTSAPPPAQEDAGTDAPREAPFDVDDIERELKMARLKAEEKALRKMLKKLRRQIDAGM